MTKGPLGDHGHDRAGEKCRKIRDFSQPQGRPRGPTDPLGPVGEKVTLHACLFFLEPATGRLGQKITFWEEGGSLQIVLLTEP